LDAILKKLIDDFITAMEAWETTVDRMSKLARDGQMDPDVYLEKAKGLRNEILTKYCAREDLDTGISYSTPPAYCSNKMTILSIEFPTKSNAIAMVRNDGLPPNNGTWMFVLRQFETGWRICEKYRMRPNGKKGPECLL
jgi:hypothetical protein